jgi:hypothetical protein
VRPDWGAFRYAAVEDVLTGARLKRGAPVALEAHNGRWLRCAKRP